MRFEKKTKIEPKIPTASMADIAFLLLIFFLATTIFRMEEGLSVHLPRAEAGEKVPREKVTHVWIDAAGNISIDDNVVTMQSIEPILVDKLRTNPSIIVGFNADRSVPYRTMDRAMEQLKNANTYSVSFTNDREGLSK